ncbi:CoA pyrophosphatase [Alphaproteobacteria bacterium]|nr:CoA pyrophosphatase [Alphaproteobacteria bacterium]MDA9165312.1 CoA pyrophosphatase [Alphaproteobacteria bacterium]MDB2583428.1 CoA pyrophosphatase [Alphaproteobacteria bacterium]MDC0970218.1 CoA pyrophosphatase [Alphaproteobacteria bacterium]
MINSITKKDLMNCINNVKNAGDKDRSNGFYSEASVMVLFTNNEKKNDSSILIIKRKDNLRKHAGQIAFPGGRRENIDKNLEETAQRETEEEVNISRTKYEIIGHFPKFYTGTGYVVTPYLGIMKTQFEPEKLIKPNSDEVEKFFFAKSNLLLSPKYQIRDKPPVGSSMFMTWKIKYGTENIWGLTARVLVTISAGLGLREFPPCDDI